MKTKTYTLNERDLAAIAEELWLNNDWFDRKGKRILLAEIENELIGYTRDHAERCDAASQPEVVA